MANQGSDDEPDYMSDDFLAKCVKDVRPGFKRVSILLFTLRSGSKPLNILSLFYPQLPILIY